MLEWQSENVEANKGAVAEVTNTIAQLKALRDSLAASNAPMSIADGQVAYERFVATLNVENLNATFEQAIAKKEELRAERRAREEAERVAREARWAEKRRIEAEREAALDAKVAEMRANGTLATDKQQSFLLKLGYFKVTRDMSKKEASAIIDQLLRERDAKQTGRPAMQVA